MEYVLIVGGVLIAILLGSFPTAVLLGKRLYGIDVREHGSGNTGATNTFRVLGKRAGTMVMLVDIFKGLLATTLSPLLVQAAIIQADDLIIFKLIFGVSAVLGHIFSVFLHFKGGKGVATLLGMILAVHPAAAGISILVFLLVLIASKYVSLGSIIGTLSFPILLLIIPPFRPEDPLLIIFGFVLFGIVVVTHQRNIRRILSGDENKTYLVPRKK